ncbi:hypothetical protein GCM10022225_49660 [Plantactinospora mayteni]|uniref:Uncharacterized protein n=1 Tax=Plantactinospora mayteni TaxID=566021 RepID=A0ABQ4EXT2_9ACTN|nr:hypothetical protein Pma05_60370 [Plantactinospora mayteni]
MAQVPGDLLGRAAFGGLDHGIAERDPLLADLAVISIAPHVVDRTCAPSDVPSPVDWIGTEAGGGGIPPRRPGGNRWPQHPPRARRRLVFYRPGLP